ncbi:MAG: DNA alkylation repair protein [Clostridia bacterium]|nr:DNA alkylation repair protein [Clostridia bacterium]
MTYSELLTALNACKEEQFAAFQRRLISTKQTILGVRTPKMRALAKEVGRSTDINELLSYPDEFFEVTFIKLAVVSALPYEQFVLYAERCVKLIDNWATCDCFKAKCVQKHREEFLTVLDGLFASGEEFSVRFVLVTLLSEYMESEYLPLIRAYINKSDTKPYYIHMAVAWLVAEILIKHYEYGLEILNERLLDVKTHNKSIQKAIESYRLSKEQKEYLRSLKIKR